MKSPIRTNNFDLIRLAAAAQVVAHHGIDNLGLDRHSGIVNVIATAIRYFPGVPIFFFVSGFLISKSFESSPSVLEYARNRVLRIYPALIVCTLLSVAVVFVLGYLPRPDAPPPRLVLWLLAQMSIVQFYNPDFMREFGVGVLNGSLWTITVELQFYAVTPLLYAVLGLKHLRGTLPLALTALILLVPNLGYWHAGPEDHPSMLLKLFGMTFLPWYSMFLVGVLAQRNFHRLHAWLSGRALLAGVVYLVATQFAVQGLGWGASNDIHPVLYVLLAAFIFSLAYTWPGTAEKILRGQDISYGVYIYHMPCINVLLYLGMRGHAHVLGFTYIAVVLMAGLSWVCIERPCLSMKRGGLRHGTSQAKPSAPTLDSLPARASLPVTHD